MYFVTSYDQDIVNEADGSAKSFVQNERKEDSNAIIVHSLEVHMSYFLTWFMHEVKL